LVGAKLKDNLYFMKEAYKQALKAYEILEAPVGAVVVRDGKVISRGYNKRESLQDPTAHAEIIAIAKASKKLKSWRLNDCDLYVTLEPCSMCAGAIINARINKVFIATPDPKSGSAGSVVDLFDVDGFNHKVKCHYGLLEEPCSNLLKNFFKMLRAKNKKNKINI
jgi:tRNA(adenine34) deaminase